MSRMDPRDYSQEPLEHTGANWTTSWCRRNSFPLPSFKGGVFNNHFDMGLMYHCGRSSLVDPGLSKGGGGGGHKIMDACCL